MNAVLAAAREEWSHCIVESDDAGRRAVARYAIDGAGWGWLRRTWAKIARQPWCGFFAAWCYRQAGLRAEACRDNLPSTYRLDRWCRQDPRRRIAIEDMHPGDILVIGNRKPYGDHITIVESVGVMSWQTIEGNAKGRLPHGRDSSPHDGVIRRTRYLREARYGVRPLPWDYDVLQA